MTDDGEGEIEEYRPRPGPSPQRVEPLDIDDLLSNLERAAAQSDMWVVRSDGVLVLPIGGVVSFFGRPASGKTWLTADLARMTVAAGGRAHLCSFEGDQSAQKMISRLLMLGLPEDDLRPGVRIYGPHLPEVEDVSEGDLVVIDPLNSAVAALTGSTPTRTKGPLDLSLMLRPYTEAGATVVLLDQSPYGDPEKASGDQSKVAMVTMQIQVKVISPLGKGDSGRIRLKVTKDRDLLHGEGTVVAEVWMVSAGRFGPVSLTWHPPGHQAPRPTEDPLQTEIWSYLVDRVKVPTAELKREISGRAEAVVSALSAMVEAGLVVVEPGPRGANLHTLATRSHDPFPTTRSEASGNGSSDTPQDHQQVVNALVRARLSPLSSFIPPIPNGPVPASGLLYIEEPHAERLDGNGSREWGLGPGHECLVCTGPCSALVGVCGNCWAEARYGYEDRSWRPGLPWVKLDDPVGCARCGVPDRLAVVRADGLEIPLCWHCARFHDVLGPGLRVRSDNRVEIIGAPRRWVPDQSARVSRFAVAQLTRDPSAVLKAGLGGGRPELWGDRWRLELASYDPAIVGEWMAGWFGSSSSADDDQAGKRAEEMLAERVGRDMVEFGHDRELDLAVLDYITRERVAPFGSLYRRVIMQDVRAARIRTLVGYR